MPIAKMIPGIINDNYGVAGGVFVAGLVAHREAIRTRLAAVVEEAEVEFGMDSKERFWSQAIALTLYGGELARQWGIIDFDPAIIKPWLKTETKRMRGDMEENVVDCVSILAQYLDEHIGERITVSKINADMTATSLKPMRSISQRYEKDIEQLWVPRHHVKTWMEKKFFNYNDTKDELYEKGVLLNPKHQKVLGAGTEYKTAQLPCWKIKMSHPDLAAKLEAGE